MCPDGMFEWWKDEDERHTDISIRVYTYFNSKSFYWEEKQIENTLTPNKLYMTEDDYDLRRNTKEPQKAIKIFLLKVKIKKHTRV